MSKLKTALTQFAKLCKLEEGDALDNIIDAVVEAVVDGDKAPEGEPSIEDRLKKLEEQADPESKDETTLSARVRKLEEGSQPDPDEEKKDEEKMTALAEKVAEKKITSFTKEIGLKRSPAAGGGYIVEDEKSKLEAEIQTQLSAGAKDRNAAVFALAKNKPEIYNAARDKGLL